MREERGEVWRSLGDLAEGAESVGRFRLQWSSETALARLTRRRSPYSRPRTGVREIRGSATSSRRSKGHFYSPILANFA